MKKIFANATSMAKKSVILGTALLMAGVANADNIQFQDSLVKELCVENWDIDGDGELSYDEAMQVESLGSVFEGMPVTTFEELQYFTGLEKIEDWAFAECTSLQKVTLPTDVKNIGEEAFYHCVKLIGMDIPAEVSEIGKAAFKSCGSLKAMVIPGNVKKIGDRTFQYCVALTSITLEDGVTSIGSRTLADCYALQFISLPSSVTEVGTYAFENSGIKSIKLSGNLPEITPYMMAGMNSLTTIDLQYNCKTIGKHAFEGCTALVSITLPPCVENIDSKAFNKCGNLKWVYVMPETPPTLAADAFMKGVDGKYLPTIYVQESVESIYAGIDTWSNFSRLWTMIIINMAKQFTSFTSNFDADFSGSDLEVFSVAGCTEAKEVILEEVEDKYVPAYTGENNDEFHGVLLRGVKGQSYNYKMGEKKGTQTELLRRKNFMVGCTNDWYIEPETESSYNYILNNNTFKVFDNAGIIKSGKAYLSLPKDILHGGKELNAKMVGFDTEATDITYIIKKDVNGEEKYYSIDGEEIDKPKGIYIHGGKKYLTGVE